MRVKIWRMRLQKLTLFRLIRPKLCEKKFQIFQIFENEIRKSLEINERKAEPEEFEPSVLHCVFLIVIKCYLLEVSVFSFL